jgi:hypothetical protein
LGMHRRCKRGLQSSAFFFDQQVQSPLATCPEGKWKFLLVIKSEPLVRHCLKHKQSLSRWGFSMNWLVYMEMHDSSTCIIRNFWRLNMIIKWISRYNTI